MKFLLPFLLLPLLALTALCLGDVPTPLSEVWHVLTGQALPDNLASFIILQVRLPQMLTALLCGCSLAAAGLVLKAVDICDVEASVVQRSGEDSSGCGSKVNSKYGGH